MGILAWILLGLVAGALAKLIMPGPQGGGIILTTVLGIVGAIVGGLLRGHPRTASNFGSGLTA
jgi:uncharacterized membrane protein YeaQ/YmgE (transglycosylase-associated protein family)